jgi:FG-GAP-like repeat
VLLTSGLRAPILAGMKWEFVLVGMVGLSACGPSVATPGAVDSSTGADASSTGVGPTPADASSSGTATEASLDASSSGEASEGESTGGTELHCGTRGVQAPTFAAPESSYGAGTIVASADFDGDARLDLLLLDAMLAATLVPGGPDGAWGEPLPLFGEQMVSLAPLDADGDAQLDLVAITQSSPRTLVISSGAGDGTFAMLQQLDLGPEFPQGVVALDVGNDGDDDIFVGGENRPMLVVHDGTFLPPLELSDNAQWGLPTGSLAVGDFDGVGGDDVAMNGKQVFLQDGVGGMTQAGPIIGGMGGHAVAAPLDADERLDLVLVEISDFGGPPWGAVSLAFGVADGFAIDVDFWATCPECGTNDSATAADVNGDGAYDIVWSSPDGLGILLGCGDGTFTEATIVDFAQELHRVVVADVDDDGRQDLVTTVVDTPDIVLFRGLDG